MRNMSFMLTTRQFRARTKTVTRRMGWANLKPGDIVCGVEKGMGLKAGEKVVKMSLIRVIATRPEPLRRLLDDPGYGKAECIKEGFGDDPVLSQPAAFVEFFCRSHRGCTPDAVPTRIEYEYLD